MVPDDLLQLVRAFQESRIVLTAVELDLFTAVGPQATAVEVAERLGTDPRATEMLMNALVALDLLTKHDNVFRNAPIAARYLDAASPENERLALMHSVHGWMSWSTLTDSVRAGTAVAYREMAERGDICIRAFIAAMQSGAARQAPVIVQAVGASGIRRMLDVGGGSAAFSIAFAEANPDLVAEVLDLAPVVEIAREHIQQAGLAERVKTRIGDLTADDFGEGYDLILLSSICHMLAPEENLDLLRRCFRALAPAGRIVLRDFILEPSRTAPRFAAIFALTMLVATQRGNSYTEQEYASWLEQAGFRDVQRLEAAPPASLMVASKPC